MPNFEYSEWDGSQEFTPLSAEDAFDKLSEYLLEHGEYVLRQLERLDPEDAHIVKKLIKEGYLEKDENGRLIPSPKAFAASKARPSTSSFRSPAKTSSANI